MGKKTKGAFGSRRNKSLPAGYGIKEELERRLGHTKLQLMLQGHVTDITAEKIKVLMQQALDAGIAEYRDGKFGWIKQKGVS